MNKGAIEIPKIFYSFETSEPFDRCVVCEKNLTVEGSDYFVEKIFRNYPEHGIRDTIIDYAICGTCAQSHYEKISAESKRAIEGFVLPAAQKHAQNFEGADITEFYQKCMVTGRSIDEVEEFQVVAHCRGGFLVPETPPYMIGMSAIEELNELLSKSTRDEMNRFYEKNLAPDPDLFKVPDDKPKLVLV